MPPLRRREKTRAHHTCPEREDAEDHEKLLRIVVRTLGLAAFVVIIDGTATERPAADIRPRLDRLDGSWMAFLDALRNVVVHRLALAPSRWSALRRARRPVHDANGTGRGHAAVGLDG